MSEQPWIDVEDRLPPKDVQVECCCAFNRDNPESQFISSMGIFSPQRGWTLELRSLKAVYYWRHKQGTQTNE